ncbi:clasp N terminal-domain-containing protein [Geranomyces variabilis]|nr:clasp N terminal-domain-containing protein [Geranomyces variabilis]KAJ3132859.1 suppressor of tub2 mutation [Geranomyces variabilis]
MASSMVLFVQAAAAPSVERKLEALDRLTANYAEVNLNTYDTAEYQEFFDALVKCIKSPQFKLTQSALAFIPTVVASIAPNHNSAPLPQSLKILTHIITPSLIERFADSKERTRELAQAAVVDLYRVICASPGARDGSPACTQLLAFLDKLVQTNAFANKVARSREQAVSWLVACAQAVPEFAMRQYVPILMKMLEDTNEGIRTASREAVVVLYNATSVKAMRTDIRKELVKNKTRGSIVEGILAQLVDNTIIDAEPLPSSSSETDLGSVAAKLNGDSLRTKREAVTPKDITPPATAGGTQAPTPVPLNVYSLRDLETEIATFCTTFDGKETEENWQSREVAIQRFRCLCRGNARDMPGFVLQLRPAVDAMARTLHSLRTALVITACSAIDDMANILGSELEPLTDMLVSNLIKLTGQAKKVVSTASINAIQKIIRQCGFQPKSLQYFATALSDKNATARAAAAVFVKTVLEEMTHESEDRAVLERTGSVDVLEKALKKGLQDANGAVRQTCREAFALFKAAWSQRGDVLFATLDAATRKAIDRAATGASSSEPTIQVRPTFKRPPASARAAVMKNADHQPLVVIHETGSRVPTPNATPAVTPNPSTLKGFKTAPQPQRETRPYPESRGGADTPPPAAQPLAPRVSDFASPMPPPRRHMPEFEAPSPAPPPSRRMFITNDSPLASPAPDPEPAVQNSDNSADMMVDADVPASWSSLLTNMNAEAQAQGRRQLLAALSGPEALTGGVPSDDDMRALLFDRVGVAGNTNACLAVLSPSDGLLALHSAHILSFAQVFKTLLLAFASFGQDEKVRAAWTDCVRCIASATSLASLVNVATSYLAGSRGEYSKFEVANNTALEAALEWMELVWAVHSDHQDFAQYWTQQENAKMFFHSLIAAYAGHPARSRAFALLAALKPFTGLEAMLEMCEPAARAEVLAAVEGDRPSQTPSNFETWINASAGNESTPRNDGGSDVAVDHIGEPTTADNPPTTNTEPANLTFESWNMASVNDDASDTRALLDESMLTAPSGCDDETEHEQLPAISFEVLPPAHTRRSAWTVETGPDAMDVDTAVVQPKTMETALESSVAAAPVGPVQPVAARAGRRKHIINLSYLADFKPRQSALLPTSDRATILAQSLAVLRAATNIAPAAEPTSATSATDSKASGKDAPTTPAWRDLYGVITEAPSAADGGEEEAQFWAQWGGDVLQIILECIQKREAMPAGDVDISLIALVRLLDTRGADFFAGQEAKILGALLPILAAEPSKIREPHRFRHSANAAMQSALAALDPLVALNQFFAVLEKPDPPPALVLTRSLDCTATLLLRLREPGAVLPRIAAVVMKYIGDSRLSLRCSAAHLVVGMVQAVGANLVWPMLSGLTSTQRVVVVRTVRSQLQVQAGTSLTV